ncbi:MAG: DUF4293 domain-containing protein [Prevotella sp.]|nr:DUF4293 domain-containing protein [Prevotella sp.]
MIQRIQTVYLLLAAILMFACACLPIGTFAPKNIGADIQMYNICIIHGDSGAWDYTTIGLAGLLAAGFITSVFNIFGYKNRKAQSRKCLIAIILMLLWVGLYAALIHIISSDAYNFTFSYAALLPIASIIMLFLARKGIIHDEKLIKSIDRIR